MPFLEDLMNRGGKRGGKRGSETKRRVAQDTSLTGEDDFYTGPGAEDTRARPKSGLLGIEPLAADRRRVCGNAACGFGWTMPWKSREHPIFEGRWACSKRCLGAMVRAALSRVADDGIDEEGPPQHQHRIPLGLVMLAQGWITHPQLQRALEAQRSHGSGRIGEWLVSECGMKPERIARGLSVQWNCPVLSTESFWPEAMALALPRVLLEEYAAVPLRLAGRQTLYVGFKDGLDASASFAIEQMTGLRTESGLLPEAEFGRARKILLGCAFPEQSLAAVSDRDGLARAIEETIEHEQPEASRLVRLHRYYWLRVWAKEHSERAAGDLPDNAAGVRDYLFTIGSRVTRPAEPESSYQQAAVPERWEPAEEPLVNPMEYPIESPIVETAEIELAEETDAGFDEPEFKTPEELKAVPGNAVEREVEAKVSREAVEPVAAVAAPETVVIKQELQRAESPEWHSLARHDTWYDGDLREDEPAARGQLVLPDEPVNLQRFMRRSLDADIETVEGEYLLELTGLESSALVFANRSLGWGRLGQLLRPRPSFANRQIESVSGRDPGV